MLWKLDSVLHENSWLSFQIARIISILYNTAIVYNSKQLVQSTSNWPAKQKSNHMLLKSSACRRIFCQISSPIRNVSSSFFVFTSQKFLIGHQGFLFTCEHSMFVGVSTVSSSSSSSLFSLSIVKLIPFVEIFNAKFGVQFQKIEWKIIV